MSMRKGNSLNGLAVIAQSNGENLGKVLDLVFDHVADECVALVVKHRDAFGLIAAQVVPWSEIITIGSDAVMVRNPASRVVANDHQHIKALMEREHHLSGTKVYTTDGQHLGSFGDVYLEPETGKVLGYEVSGGFVSDTVSGKRFLPADVTHEVGKDTVLVPPQAAAIFDDQAATEPGGLKGVTKSAADKVSETYDNIATASVEKQQEFVVGKTAGQDVYLPLIEGAATTELGASELNPETNKGELLIRKGETIGRLHAMRATHADILGTLVTSAIAGGAVGQYESAKEKVAGATSGYSDSAAEAAIGKPVSHDVTLPNGEILIASGQIVTPAVMAEAKARGKDKEVIAAAGLGAASEKLQSGTQTVKEGAHNLWDTVKEKAAALSDSAQEKKAELDEAAQQKRINNALGHPANRVILAPDDSVILNTGDIITHKAVNTARETGVLDVLLDSVYSADPEITPEMMRLEGKGEAALENQAEPSGGPITATISPNEPAQSEPAQGDMETTIPTFDGKPPIR